jgi:hypothetical protein
VSLFFSTVVKLTFLLVAKHANVHELMGNRAPVCVEVSNISPRNALAMFLVSSFFKVFELARGEEEWTEYDSPSAICALSIHFTPHRTLIRNSLHLLPEALTVTVALSQVSNCDY